jgi:aspartyl-tRNA(Asn)/glutamyl-tRNA(Gln) amidotransferase subunit C
MDTKTDKIITEDVVRHVARLSRLELAPDEVARFQEQLGRILDYVAQLNEVDTDGVQPTTHVLSSMKNVFRDDEPRPSLSPDEALSNAPARYQDFFKVPKVIKDA